MNYKKNVASQKIGGRNCWNDQIMERFIKANLFIICCVAAGLLLIVYLGAFSCEVSWILEAHGDLPVSSYILCTQFFVVFVATTILIHGLVTNLPWGLFAWSVIIGLLAIPELVFVMIMTTQHWGLQSLHGLTELISYLVRLVINCFALICVIPTGLRWRRESQMLTQLQDLATRLQLQTPPPSAPITSQSDSRRSSKRIHQTAFENIGGSPLKMQMSGGQSQGFNVFNNSGNQIFGSQNEFNASLFAPTFLQQFPNGLVQRGNRAQSLMDLRCTLPGMYNPRFVLDTEDKNGKYFNITIDDLKNNMQDSHKSQTPSLIGSVNDPIYCSIEPKQLAPPPLPPHQRQREQQGAQKKTPAKLARNCVSLENLDGINKVQNDLAAYGHNLLQNYTQQQQQQFYLANLAMLSGYLNPPHHSSNMNVYRRPSTGSTASGIISRAMIAQPLQAQSFYGGFGYANYANPYIMANSKLSLGNESDDYRQYRDVAL